jgi:hypothetical protein
MSSAPHVHTHKPFVTEKRYNNACPSRISADSIRTAKKGLNTVMACPGPSDYRRPILTVYLIFPFLLCFGLLTPHGYSDTFAEKARALAQKYGSAVVTVRAVLETRVNNPTFEVPDMEDVTEVRGFIVDPAGYVVTSMASLGVGNQTLDDSTSIESRPRRFTILLEQGQKEYEAKAVLQDETADVLILKMESQQEPFPTIPLTPSEAPLQYDPVFVLSRLNRVVGYALGGNAQRIEAVIEKPRRYYVLPWVADLGVPVFGEGGKFVGIVVERTLPGQTNLVAGDPFSAMENAVSIILPAATLEELLNEAKQQKPADSPTESSPTPPTSPPQEITLPLQPSARTSADSTQP